MHAVVAIHKPRAFIPGGFLAGSPPPEAPFCYLYEMSPLKRGFRYIFFE